jgi:phosphatidylinositol dimannoside acyltransferase
MVRYYSVRSLAWLAQRLPVDISYLLATVVGDIVYLTWWRGRTNTIHNFRRVLGSSCSEIEVRRTARRSFHNYHRSMVDFLRLPRLTSADAAQMISSRGWEHLDAAFTQGKGALLIGTHFGNWDMAGLALAARNYPVNAIADGFGSKRLENWVRSLRESHGIRIISMSNGGLKTVYHALRHNEAVGIIFDRPAGRNGVEVEFFGEKTRFPAGPAVLALRTGAPVVVGYLVRMPDGMFGGEIEQVAVLNGKAKYDKSRSEEDIQEVTQIIVRCFEDYIRRYPDQWYMFRRMWN